MKTLVDMQELNQRIIEAMPGGIVHVLIDGSIITANDEALRILGLSYDELTHRYTSDFKTETYLEDGTPCPVEEYPVSKALATGEPQPPMTIGVKKPDSNISWAVFRAIPVFEKNKVAGAVVTFIDITESRSKTRRVQESETRWHSLIENFPHYFTTFDREGKIISVSKVDPGLTKEIVLNSTVYDFYPEEVHEEVRARHARIIATGKSESYRSPIKIDDKIKYFDCIEWPVIENGKVKLINVIATDVTEEALLRQQLEYHATHDFLTDLHNRYFFEKKTRAAISQAKENNISHAFCYIDLDQFKIINDTCGHVAGDALLQQLASALKDELESNMILSRLGGDEFGLLLPEVSVAQAREFADHVCDTISKFVFHWKDKIYRISASIGIAMIDSSTESYTRLLRDADIACLGAKDAGRNQARLFSVDDIRISLRQSDMKRIELINESLDSNSFILFGQRIEHLVNAEPKVCCEVLTRMNDNGQLALPLNFILAAERYDLMDKVDLAVIEKTLNFFSDNQPAASQLGFVTINLSGKSVGKASFQRDLARLVDQCSLPHNKLFFEITETAAISNIEMTKKFMNQLGELGVQFVLDDFGTGVSSFGYLRSLPVSHIKIDGQFVKNVLNDKTDFTLVKAIHELSMSLGKITIAEFVEKQEILEALKDIGIDYGQGYHLHKPEPIENLFSAQ